MLRMARKKNIQRTCVRSAAPERFVLYLAFIMDSQSPANNALAQDDGKRAGDFEEQKEMVGDNAVSYSMTSRTTL